MLAFMPQSRTRTAHEPTSTGTMSLAILPSQPMAYVDAPTLLLPSPAKRPKLSLDTNNVPSIFGKSSTSLRLETLSATSPTARNTFRNAHSPTQAQQIAGSRASKPTLKQIATNLSIHESTRKQIDVAQDESAASSASASSASTIDSISSVIPYKVAYTSSSILANGPLPRMKKSRAGLRLMFPAPKKVAFRSPLTEEVKNTKFTLRHSDIESSASTISTLELSPSEDKVDSPTIEKQTEDRSKETALKPHVEPQTGDKRESSDEEDSDSSCPATPVAGRRKRHRQWVWTLGPINNASKDEQTSSTSSDEQPVNHHSNGVQIHAS